MLLSGFSLFLTLINLAMLVLAVIAFLFALLTREDAFRAAGKRTKPFWLILLGVVVAVNLFVPILFLQIAGVVASIVYLVDVRPAVRQVRRHDGRTNMGPYGPW
jgi:Protein of unknown function (DUF2516)